MNLNPKTWQSVISSVGLVFGGALAYAGIVDQTSVSNIVQKAVDAAPAVTQAIGVLVPLGITIWKAFQHTDATVVQEASKVQGLAEPIKISPSAPEDLQALAKDRNLPNVQPAAPASPPIERHHSRAF